MKITNPSSCRKIATVFFPLILLIIKSTMAQITWPSSQLLPTFPTPAQTQDLIFLRETSSRWEAEGTSIGHNTGRLEGDGWLCEAGIDAPNNHMIYGPYDNTIPAGANVAEFRMKTDNNTANNDPLVDIDVRDATTGSILALKTITRQQFQTAGNYTNFTLPFTMPADNHSIELRVYWRGGGYIKVDWVSVHQNSSTPEMYLFASLKGIVNRTQPRIFSYEGDAFAEGPYTWLQSLGLNWTEYSNKWDLISKYRNEIGGLIVYDPAQIHTVNLATMLAKDKKALIASPALLSKLTSAPYNLPILVDLRGQFTSKMHVYQTIYNNYWPSLDHRLLIGLNPEIHKAAMREYAVATGLACIWLDPQVAGESELLNSFLSSMPAGANYLGWWQDEAPGVERGSRYGISTIASDWATNLTMHSGMPRTVNVKPIPPKPQLQNKIYVAFILSDGDNLQYIEHLMRKLWNNPDRGSVPIGWTVSPAMLDAMPGALNFYHQTATNNDNLISGPSGYGYAYPNNFPNQSSLDQFVAKTEDYNHRAGFRVITIWNTITGGINQNVGQSFAQYAPSTLGLTAQNTGGGLTIYNNSLPGMALSCNYCTNEQAMKDHIASASAGWNGAEPRFVIIQAQPWTDVKPSNFKNVANSLNSNYVVVRPDHLFMLMREAKGLPIDPAALNGTGDGLTGNYFNGMNFETPVTTRKDATVNFNWNGGSPATGVNADQFTARWTGQVQPRYSGTYTFYLTSDNGRRLWVNNQLIIDKWQDDWDITYSGTINLTAGEKYNIRVDYFENNGGANCKLEWSSPQQAREIIPQSQLYSNNLPTVSITSPASNASFTAPATINLTVNASDINGSVSKVEYFQNGNKIGESSVAPYSITWNNVAVGNYSITARVTDNLSAVATSTPVSVVVNTISNNGDGLTGNYFSGMNFETLILSRKDATINFDWGSGSPVTGINNDSYSVRWTGQIQPKYSGQYTFYINSDNGRRLWINNQLIIDKWIDDWGVEYSGSITLTAGQKYDIKLEYFENWGGANCKLEWSSASQAREVVPQTHLFSNALPAINLSTSSTTFTAPALISLNVNTSDGDGSISSVTYYNGNTILATVNSPFTYNWNNVGEGTYTITARATDNRGGVTVSSPITITVNQGNINKAPSVSIISPANNSSFNAPASITINANANDADGSISKVEFFNGATPIGTDNTSPYSILWSNVAAGTYNITARATDNTNAVTTSAVIVVTVKSANNNTCTNIPQYVQEGGYVAGSKVQNGGSQYECKPHPFSGWCNGASWAYAPGTGAYWQDAWILVGPCTVQAAPAIIPASTTASSSKTFFGPNPAEDIIHLTIDKPTKVTIYNNHGYEVISQTSIEDNGNLDVTNLPAGIYNLKIDTGTEVIHTIMMKQ